MPRFFFGVRFDTDKEPIRGAHAQCPASAEVAVTTAPIESEVHSTIFRLSGLRRPAPSGIRGGASIYPFVWNILLAARNEGYGGTITTNVVAEEPRVRDLLGVPKSYAIAAVLPLGKRRRQLTKLKRNSVTEIATRERFDGKPFRAK
jgi:nitroreductase